MNRAGCINIDADARVPAQALEAGLGGRRRPSVKVNMASKEVGQKVGLPIPQLAQDKPVEPGIRPRPGKLVVRQSSGGEGFAPRGMEAIQGI